MQSRRNFKATALGMAILGLFGVATPALANQIKLDQPEHFSNGSETPALTSNQPGTVGKGSWQADASVGSGQQHTIYLQGDAAGPYDNGGQTSYAEAGKNPRLLFPGDTNVRISDLVSLSYDTKTSARYDGFVNIYTKPDGVNDRQGWYGYQFDLAASYAQNTEVENGFTRHTLDLTGGSVYEDEDLRDGGGLTTYTLPLLQTLFGDESLLYVSLATATNYQDFAGFLDNFQCSYRGGDGTLISRQIDFEPLLAQDVPVPAVWPLFSFGFLAMFGMASYRRRQL